MSFVSRYTGNIPITTSEPDPEVAQPQPAPQPAPPPAGIASAPDGYEAASQGAMNLFTDQAVFAAPTQQQLQPDPAVDAASVFDFVVADQVPAPTPTAGPEEGLGQTFENLAEKTVTNLYEGNTSKEFGPDKESTSTQESKNWGDNVNMPDNLSDLGSGGGTTAFGLEGSWNLAEFGKIDEKAEGEWGSAYAKGSTQVLGLSGQVYTNIGVNTDTKSITAGIGAKGSVEIVGAHYEAGYKTPPINIGDETVDLNGQVNGDAYVGVKGSAEIGVSLGGENYVKAGAGAFDGANAELKGKIGVGDIGDVHGELGAWAGVGAKAEFKAGFEDGKLNVDMGLGLALGAGAEWDAGITIDFSEIVDTGLEAMKEIGLGEEANWIENTAGDIIGFAGDVAKETGETLEDIGGEIGDAADDTGDAIGEALDAAGDAAGDALDEVGEVAGDVGDALGIDDWF